MSSDYKIRAMRSSDRNEVAKLEARVFGPGRFARTAYRLRENQKSHTILCMTAWADDELAGAIRFTHITLGENCTGALLGPLTVNPHHAGYNLGLRLIAAAKQTAQDIGLDALLLVGDIPYYGRAGFKQVRPGQLSFPGPVDPARLLILPLHEERAENCHGPITASSTIPGEDAPNAEPGGGQPVGVTKKQCT